MLDIGFQIQDTKPPELRIQRLESRQFVFLPFMSLHIQNLTKVYGHQKVVDNISFSIGEGEIVGFLGPNGAGKSTTMKIATGYIPPTEGTVTVGGFDVVQQPMQVK